MDNLNHNYIDVNAVNYSIVLKFSGGAENYILMIFKEVSDF